MECPYCGRIEGTCSCGPDGEGAPWALNEAEDDYSEESSA